MGQGAEDAGGYEVDYDPFEEGKADGMWPQQHGRPIRITNMTLSHLRNARRMARDKAACANFSSDAATWNEWVEMFDDEILRRECQVSNSTPKLIKAPQPARGTKVKMICHCGNEYDARQADLDRKWGLSCSKSCASIRREFGRPAAKRKVV